MTNIKDNESSFDRYIKDLGQSSTQSARFWKPKAKIFIFDNCILCLNQNLTLVHLEKWFLFGK